MQASSSDEPASRRRVWITRAEPGAWETARSASALGFEPLVGPLLRVEPTGEGLALEPGEALAFTSAQAARLAAALISEREIDVYAVGDATAAAAREAGFARVSSASGDVEALVQLIVAEAKGGRIVHAAAVETAGDLTGGLRAVGVAARKAAIYRSVARSDLPDLVAEALGTGDLHALVVHSPKAARTAARLLKGCAGLAGSLRAVALSPACLEPLKDLGLRGSVAAVPTEAALLDALALGSEPGA